MAVNIEVNGDALKPIEDSSHVQYVPCQIDHDGEAEVKNLFNVYVKENAVEEVGEEKTDDHVEESSMDAAVGNTDGCYEARVTSNIVPDDHTQESTTDATVGNTDDCYEAVTSNIVPDDHTQESTTDASMENTDDCYEAGVTNDVVPDDDVEKSAMDAAVRNTADIYEGVTYHIINYGTKKLRPKLMDSLGYTYTVKRQTASYIDWICSKRSKVVCCMAALKQRCISNTFMRGKHDHIHPPADSDITAAKVWSNIKRAATFETSTSHVDNMFREDLRYREQEPLVPNRPSASALHWPASHHSNMMSNQQHSLFGSHYQMELPRENYNMSAASMSGSVPSEVNIAQQSSYVPDESANFNYGSFVVPEDHVQVKMEEDIKPVIDTDKEVELDDTLPEHATNEEVELEDDTAVNASDKDGLTYYIISCGTKKQKPMLVDSLGYTYTTKRQTTSYVDWDCTERNKGARCNAKVKQRCHTNTFSRRGHDHIHPPKDGAVAKAKKRSSKQRAATLETSSTSHVDNVFREDVQYREQEPLVPNLPSVSALDWPASHHSNMMSNQQHSLFGSHYQMELPRENYNMSASSMSGSVPSEVNIAQQGSYVPDESANFNYGSFVVPEDHVQVKMEEDIKPVIDTDKEVELDDTLPEHATNEEVELEDDTTVNATDEHGVQYHVINSGTKKQKPMLVDSRGYSYSMKRQTPSYIDWDCTVRSKAVRCRAGVKQRCNANTFMRRGHDHIHPPKDGALATAKIRSKIKELATRATSSSTFVINHVLIEELQDNGQTPLPDLPSMATLSRAFNRHRQKLRKKEKNYIEQSICNQQVPAICDQQVPTISDQQVPPVFLREDILVANQRHLVLGTDCQLELLRAATVWYVDTTYNIIQAPFTQLLSVHAFVQQEKETMQVPLLFVLMSSAQKEDYHAVFMSIRKLLPGEVKVKKMVLDYEDTLWRSIPTVFADISLHGCNFHWVQCIWRKIQELGLADAYKNDGVTNRYCKQLMALPYLPADCIPAVFNDIQVQAATESLRELAAQISNQWITSTIMPPAAWSVFNQPVRTNSDLEGWREGLNHQAQLGQLPLYLLIMFLNTAASLVPLHVKPVSEEELKHYQGNQLNGLQGKVFATWAAYMEGNMTANALLLECARLIGQRSE